MPPEALLHLGPDSAVVPHVAGQLLLLDLSSAAGHHSFDEFACMPCCRVHPLSLLTLFTLVLYMSRFRFAFFSDSASRAHAAAPSTASPHHAFSIPGLLVVLGLCRCVQGEYGPSNGSAEAHRPGTTTAFCRHHLKNAGAHCPTHMRVHV